MIVFALLLVFWGATHVPALVGWRILTGRADRLGWAMGLTLLVTGTTHFTTPEPYLAMMPPALPSPRLLVYLSGLAEIAVGIGLCARAWRAAAALAAVVLFVAVSPANVYAAASGTEIPNYPASPIYRWARLPMQAVLIAWALWVWREVRRAGR